MMGAADDRGLNIFDEEDGISIEVPFFNGASVKLYMDDAVARDMIGIIENKLVARGK